jgi:SAM-dependent methyltransferase
MISGGGFTARHYITMALSHLFAENAIVRLILGNSERRSLIVSMTGVKLGERLIVIGLSDPGLLSTLGSKVGITGRACGVDASPERMARASRRAEADGVLVEVQGAFPAPLPYDPASFDVAVVWAAADLGSEPGLWSALEAARRVLRDGGRCQVIGESAPSGLRRFWGTPPARLPAGQLVAILGACGFRGARVLAERDGLVFVEGVYRS